MMISRFAMVAMIWNKVHMKSIHFSLYNDIQIKSVIYFFQLQNGARKRLTMWYAFTVQLPFSHFMHNSFAAETHVHVWTIHVSLIWHFHYDSLHKLLHKFLIHIYKVCAVSAWRWATQNWNIYVALFTRIHRFILPWSPTLDDIMTFMSAILYSISFRKDICGFSTITAFAMGWKYWQHFLVDRQHHDSLMSMTQP
jgi:hypothetical protein